LKVLEYSPGGAFGELALLHGEPRLATVRATRDCVCWALDRDTFRKIMVSTGRQDMTDRTSFLSKVPVLQELTPFERFKIAEVRAPRPRAGEGACSHAVHATFCAASLDILRPASLEHCVVRAV
jgi:hypothetical protein